MISLFRAGVIAAHTTSALRAEVAGRPDAISHLESILTGPRPLLEAQIVVGSLMAVVRRASGTPEPGSVLMPVFSTIDKDSGVETTLTPETADPGAGAWGRMLVAYLSGDAGTYDAVWQAHVATDVDRARALTEFALAATADVVNQIPCTCGECPGAQNGGRE